MFVSALAFAAGCGGGDEPSGDDFSPWHCWDSDLRCLDGRVEYGACDPPTLIHECLRGCREEPLPRGHREPFDTSDEAPIELYCAAAGVGDPCRDDADCLPAFATARPDGTVTQDYLRCEDGACVLTASPVIDGWLEPCDPGPTQPRFHGLGDNNCLVDHPTETCRNTGKTIVCYADWQCPEGATCDAIEHYTWGQGFPRCRPGPRGTPIDLGC